MPEVKPPYEIKTVQYKMPDGSVKPKRVVEFNFNNLTQSQFNEGLEAFSKENKSLKAQH